MAFTEPTQYRKVKKKREAVRLKTSGKDTTETIVTSLRKKKNK